jgi:hypothetical protein
MLPSVIGSIGSSVRLPGHPAIVGRPAAFEEANHRAAVECRRGGSCKRKAPRGRGKGNASQAEKPVRASALYADSPDELVAKLSQYF